MQPDIYNAKHYQRGKGRGMRNGKKGIIIVRNGKIFPYRRKQNIDRKTPD